jgi:hypothetical protein
VQIRPKPGIFRQNKVPAMLEFSTMLISGL